jgi:hypothetical protein
VGIFNWYYLSSPPQILRCPEVHLETGGLKYIYIYIYIIIIVTWELQSPECAVVVGCVGKAISIPGNQYL